MIRQLALLTSVVLSTGFTPMTDFARDPMGENANYQLDKAPARTTGMVKAGTAVASVNEFLPDHAQGPSYNVQLDYDITVQFYGRQQGTAKWAFAKEFFEPSFMETLRQTGHYETPDYKINHEGFADTRTMDGTSYVHCDKILIYDVKVPEVRELEKILNLAAGAGPNDKAAPVENLQIRAHIFAGTPVLSAVKLDLSGVSHGMNVKAGFDFKK